VEENLTEFDDIMQKQIEEHLAEHREIEALDDG